MKLIYSGILFFIVTVFLSCRKNPIGSKINKPAETPVQYKTENNEALEPQFRNHPVGIKREFRGAWVATIANIDWPTRKILSSEDQQTEFKQLISIQKKAGINAVLVQVRAASDAFYARSVEPWSEWLTGVQGNSPEPYYDPMLFMIEEAHENGLEFHAWLNLNRGMHKNATSLTSDHITVTHPEWFFSYSGYKIYDFGIPQVRDYIKEIVLNIVRNYDVDGIHFDDYFYPYQETGQVINDRESFRRYGRGFSNIEDWRRYNINILVKELSEEIRKEKKWVKFGISPFGVWRNKSDDPEGSETRAGQPSYDNLYADTRKWAQYGWVDYIAPQAYFPFEHKLVPYAKLTDWWSVNHGKALLYMGQGIYRVDANSDQEGWNNPRQIPRQIRYNRLSGEVTGSIYFSSKNLVNNKLGVSDSLRKYYAGKTLMPEMPWKDQVKPNAPYKIEVSKIGHEAVVVKWQKPEKPAHDGDEPTAYVVYRFDENEELNLENAGAIQDIVRAVGINNYIDRNIKNAKSYYYVVTSLDRVQNESLPSKPILWKP